MQTNPAGRFFAARLLTLCRRNFSNSHPCVCCFIKNSSINFIHVLPSLKNVLLPHELNYTATKHIHHAASLNALTKILVLKEKIQAIFMPNLKLADFTLKTSCFTFNIKLKCQFAIFNFKSNKSRHSIRPSHYTPPFILSLP